NGNRLEGVTLAVVVGEELQGLVIRIRRARRGPARREIDALLSQNAISVGITESGGKIRFAGEGRAPFGDAEFGPRISLVDEGAHARNAERIGIDRLNAEATPSDVGRGAEESRIPPIAVDADSQRLQLSLRQPAGIGVGISVDIEDIERTRARNGVGPRDLIQPPGEKIHAAVARCVARARSRSPVVIPATTDRTESNSGRIPGLQLARLRQEYAAQFTVSRRVGMNVAVRASPDVDFVVHVVEVGDAVAEGGGECGGPVVAVDAVRP